MSLGMQVADLGMETPAIYPGGQVVRLALVVEYDGTSYAGSQYQQHLPTIQGELEKALAQLTGEKLRVNLAGRTDAGAHARYQVVSFCTASALETRVFLHGLNHHLPEDIVVKCVRRVGLDFDPRRHATRREYVYRILNDDVRSPLYRNRAFQVPGRLDEHIMNTACGHLVGEHDFAAFCPAPVAGKSTIRRVFTASVIRHGKFIDFTVAANAFLPHQVRCMAGTLIRVGQGKLSLDDFSRILASRQPVAAGPVAPASGLYLNVIEYNDYLKEESDEDL